jgi:predicted GNAT family acetyltransferase
MAIDGPPAVDPDPEVRLVQPDELDLLMPACIEMFTEEVGVSPLVGDGGVLYRARVEELIATGRAFARIEDGHVVFKAEVGAATSAACQVQGVWVHPTLRGRGVGTAGMAAVVRGAQASIAPVVSLYVNDFNRAARRSYEKVGFREVATFASILF